MADPETPRDRDRVIVAGAGVAGLEALLALHELAGNALDVTLLAPDDEFRYRQLSVATPFENTEPPAFPVAEMAADLGAVHVRDRLVGVDPEAKLAHTAEHGDLAYEHLLLTTGVRNADPVPGGTVFGGFGDAARFRELLETIEAGEATRVAFAVPGDPSWPLPLYELAMLTAAHAAAHGAELATIVVSPESSPLELFGPRASAAVRSLLEEAGVTFEGGRTPKRFSDGHLHVGRHRSIDADVVVTLPAAIPPTLPGVPRDARTGFIPVNAFGRVMGLEDVYAAGDATWNAVKQGGVAAQQADSAATAIAESAGLAVPAQPCRPVLRGALLTPWGPRYLRCDPDGESVAASSILWWPPTKVGGRLLGPYLARRSGRPDTGDELRDVAPPPTDDPGRLDSGHEDAVALALASAGADAQDGEYRRALHWLTVAEDLELRLPPEFEAKRSAWRSLAEQHGS